METVVTVLSFAFTLVVLATSATAILRGKAFKTASSDDCVASANWWNEPVGPVSQQEYLSPF